MKKQMLLISVSYSHSPGFSSPQAWFKRTEGYKEILECLGKNNRVISIKQIDYTGKIEYNYVDYHFLDLNKEKTYFPAALNRYISKLNPDVVFLQGLHHPVQFLQLKLMLKKGVRIIAQHHAEKPMKGVKKYVQLLADRYIDAYLFASRSMGIDWIKRGNLRSEEKIHEVMEVSSIFYPLSRESARSKTGISLSQAFLWVGRLNENKDPLNVVKAFLKFSERNSQACLYMAYHTDELIDEIKALIDENSAGERVVLVGPVPHEELLYWFNSVDFYISGSHYEGSGTALCEAMSCGCIPVVTDIDSFRTITNNGKCGILYTTGDLEALEHALEKTLTLDIAKQKQASIDYFRANLSFETIAGKIQKIVQGLMP